MMVNNVIPHLEENADKEVMATQYMVQILFPSVTNVHYYPTCPSWLLVAL
jgi:hypothetical protein